MLPQKLIITGFLAAAAGVVTDLRRYRGLRNKRATCGVAKSDGRF